MSTQEEQTEYADYIENNTVEIYMSDDEDVPEYNTTLTENAKFDMKKKYEYDSDGDEFTRQQMKELNNKQ